MQKLMCQPNNYIHARSNMKALSVTQLQQRNREKCGLFRWHQNVSFETAQYGLCWLLTPIVGITLDSSSIFCR
jgi:hypothetical protein